MKPHHWSGWPGACCLDCGCEDPLEIALADNKEEEVLQHMEDNPGDYQCPAPIRPISCGQCKAMVG